MQTLKIFSFLTIIYGCSRISSFAQKQRRKQFLYRAIAECANQKLKKLLKCRCKGCQMGCDAKVLTVKYNSSSTNAAKIQQAVAAVGYDTRDVKATDEAYDKLHGCCQYDRAGASTDDQKMDCCKDGKCSKPGHDGKDCCKKDDDKMDCCKDGKCSKPGHDGKDCCKASHSH